MKELYAKIHKEATEHAYETYGSDVMIYPCGFALIEFSEELLKNSKEDSIFSYLLSSGIAKYDSIDKVNYIWVSDFNQSFLHKYAYAKKFVSLLEENGYPGATMRARLD